MCGIAGRSKERAQSKQLNEAAGPRASSFAKGLTLALVAGAGSAFQNFGLAFGVPLLRRAAELGADQSYQSNVIWAPLLTATLVPYFDFLCTTMEKESQLEPLFRVQNRKVLAIRSAHGRTLVFKPGCLRRGSGAHGGFGPGAGVATLHVCNYFDIERMGTRSG